MDGVIMYRTLKNVLICAAIAAGFWVGVLIADRQALNENIIRFHVVANSNLEEDQSIKLQVRDAVLNRIQKDLHQITDVETARKYLQDNLMLIQRIANETLAALGCEEKALVTLCKEKFGTRIYDTFTLPAGVYESLRISIGEAAGKNWWCVAFPTLCIPATAECFVAAAAGAGFSEPLSKTLTREPGYEIRFFLLDAMGNVQNFLERR